MRTVHVTADRTAPIAWLRDDDVVALDAGVTLTLPAPVSDCRVRVKALGAGCNVISAAGIETTGMTTSVANVSVPIGDVKALVSYRDAATGVQSAWLNSK